MFSGLKGEAKMQKNFVLKAKNTVKRIAAISTSTVMLGATMMGAVAALDLGDYPSPFVGADGALSGLVVVGADAASADVVGATELVSTLTQATVTGTTTTTTVAGGKSKDINLGGNLTDDFSTSGLDDDDLAGFQDGTIDFNDTTYNVHDALYLGQDLVTIETSITASDDDYGSNVGIELLKKGIKYYYLFDEVIALDTVNTDTAAEFDFLGKAIKITKVSSSDHNTLTAQVGTEYFLNTGDSVTVDGKIVTLQDVSSAATCTVSVSVDGVQEVVTTTSETVNGLKIEADECFYTDTKSERSASVIVGEFTSKSYDDGDAFIGQDENDPDWVWDLGNLNDTNTVGGTNCTLSGTGANGPCIGVVNDFVRDDWDDGPAQVGDSYCLPYNYACVSFDKLLGDQYVDITIEVDTSLDADEADIGTGFTYGSSEDVITISANKDDTLVLDHDAGGWTVHNSTSVNRVSTFTADIPTKEIYIVNGKHGGGLTGQQGGYGGYVEILYLDENNDVKYAGNVTLGGGGAVCVTKVSQYFAFVDYIDTTGAGDIPITIENSTQAITQLLLTFKDAQTANTRGYDVQSNWSTSGALMAHLGATASTEEAGELRYVQNVSSGYTAISNLGTKDEDHRTHYGIVVYDPKSNGASDNVKFSVPSQDMEATIVVSGSGTTTTTAAGAVTVVSVAGTDVAKLDTEVASPSAQNLILVGGPAVNRLTAQALGLSYPTTGTDSTIPENKGLLKLVSNAFGGSNSALVVAGWNADDTRAAADVLKRYGDYSAQLSGQSAVEVSGTSVTAVGSSATVE